jgi:RNA polymerase sigma-70 factor (ECF subfamily)
MADHSSAESMHLNGLLDRLGGGDEGARSELIEHACERLRRLSRKMLKGFPGVKRWEETDDVLQNVLIRLHRSLAEVKPRTVRDFLSLACTQIRRELIDLSRHYYGPHGLGAHYNSSPPHKDLSGVVQQAYEQEDLSGEPGRLAQWREFHERVEALPAEEREVFNLLWYQELTQAQAAAVLNIPERTLQRRWQSARLRLHDALDGRLPG